MHIVYASFDAVPSFKAASTHLLANCRAPARRHELTLLTLGDTALPARGGFRHQAANLKERNYLRRGFAFRDFVRSHLQLIRPAVFHFRTPWEGLLAGELGLTGVYEVNGLPSIELPYLYRDAGPKVLEVLRQWEQACLEQARAIVCPSERIRECLLRRYRVPDPGCIRVIPNGYDPVAQVPAPPSDGPLRAVYLGTLHPWQGILWSLRAFAPLRGLWELDIYGVGQRAWLRWAEKRIVRYGLESQVRLHPPLDRNALEGLLGGYHAGLAPLLKTERNADQGCCPVKIMDYLAHGLVTVAPELAAVRAMLEHGHNGLLYAPNSLQGFADRLRELHRRRSELPTMRETVRASLQDFPTWDQCSERLLAVYESIA
jgi:glycosyltransferase involved in cell wall biosynthesis